MKPRSIHEKIDEPADNDGYLLEMGSGSVVDESVSDEEVRNRETIEAMGKKHVLNRKKPVSGNRSKPEKAL